tara:strand:+ start:1219 stop:3117 length:1899 start_codon:yes stop_codon:yes gene_type:complete
MATYREIHGRAIQSLSTDPSAETDAGQIWYNTTSDTFKSILNLEAWISGANMIDAIEYSAGFGIQTAAVTAGGQNGPAKDTVEEYNGSGWSAGTALPGVRSDIQQLGFGSLTAGVVAGGYNAAPGAALDTSLEYDGSSWTSGGTMPTATRGGGAAGSLTAGVIFGGQAGNSPTPIISATQEYDGTNWATNPNPMGTGRKGAGSAVNGTQTTAMAFCGQSTTPPAPYNQLTEEYDGSSWTTGGTFPAARTRAAGAGTSAAGLGFGGDTPPGSMSAVTAKYDGSSWTTTGNMGTARRAMGSAGTQTAGLTFGGDANPPITTATEEFNSSATAFTAAAWASGPNMITGRAAVKGAGSQTAAFALGGETAPGPTVNSTENFDGSSWTAGGAFPATTRSAFTCGTQTAGLGAGGNSSPGQTPYNTASAEYDGSSWTASPGSMSPGKGYGAMSGVQTTALATGGDGPSNPSHPFAQVGVQSYNGSTWSSETDYPTTFYGGTGAGISESAAVVWGGSAPYPGTNPSTADYNGSAWTLVATTITSAGAPSTSGCQGTNQSPAASCGSMGGTSGGTGYFQWNDTAWSTLPNMGTGGDRGGAGTLTAAIAFGGYHPGEPRMDDTEEFTAVTTAMNVKTLTQS